MASATVSTTATFNQTRDAICRRALRLIGAFASGETPGAQEMNDCSDALNAMTKEWQAEGLHVWTETEGVLFPQPGQLQYSLGIGTGDFVYAPPGVTSLTTVISASATVLPCVPPAGTAVGDIVLVVNASGSFSSATATAIGSASITVAAPGIGPGALQGAAVYTNHPANAVIRPLRVLSVRRSNILSGIDTPIKPMARLDYQGLPNKTQAGTMNSWFYDPQLTYGLMNIWQPPMSPIQDILKFTYQRPINDWSTSANIGDFPQEWLSALAYNLAVEIAPEYDVPLQKIALLGATAQDKKQTASGFDKESESIFFGAATDPGSWR